MTSTLRAWDAQRGDRRPVPQAQRRAALATAIRPRVLSDVPLAAQPVGLQLLALTSGEPVDLEYSQVRGIVPDVQPGRVYRIHPEGSATPLPAAG